MFGFTVLCSSQMPSAINRQEQRERRQRRQQTCVSAAPSVGAVVCTIFLLCMLLRYCTTSMETCYSCVPYFDHNKQHQSRHVVWTHPINSISRRQISTKLPSEIRFCVKQVMHFSSSEKKSSGICFQKKNGESISETLKYGLLP